MVTCWRKKNTHNKNQRTIVVCAIDWSLIEIKQFLYFTHQHSEKHKDIRWQATFGFKY